MSFWYARCGTSTQTGATFNCMGATFSEPYLEHFYTICGLFAHLIMHTIVVIWVPLRKDSLFNMCTTKYIYTSGLPLPCVCTSNSYTHKNHEMTHKNTGYVPTWFTEIHIRITSRKVWKQKTRIIAMCHILRFKISKWPPDFTTSSNPWYIEFRSLQ